MNTSGESHRDQEASLEQVIQSQATKPNWTGVGREKGTERSKQAQGMEEEELSRRLQERRDQIHVHFSDQNGRSHFHARSQQDSRLVKGGRVSPHTKKFSADVQCQLFQFSTLAAIYLVGQREIERVQTDIRDRHLQHCFTAL